MNGARGSVFDSSSEVRARTNLDTRDGMISLLSLKHHLMLFYLQSLVLLVARRAAGDTLEDRTPASLSLSTAKRDARAWAGVGDLVDSMIEGLLENRIKYQIDKLVRIANDALKNVADDPLAFRPNPQNLVDNDQAPNAEDPSRPHLESSSGLGAMPALASGRAREIQRMTEFEEDNFTRLIMKKKEAQSHGRRRGRGLEDEFEDVLRSVGRTKASAMGDGYEELRQKGKKADAFLRSRTRIRDDADDGEDEVRQPKRSRFHNERRALTKNMAKARRSSVSAVASTSKKRKVEIEATMLASLHSYLSCTVLTLPP
ncbi:hypothetical protein L210DRAFT_3612466 [Boletus edulis BED1]|uniref:Uncharacterized protein n=1 Tax=Boletus edulis BED1 TaxID=1328754 RepID=A0AAD4BU65_BOLED|nr:hypothetical protein L210DRAFT_3612466 [Boletus edulis BED1]